MSKEYVLSYARVDDGEIVVSESDVRHPRSDEYNESGKQAVYDLINDLADVPSFASLFAGVSDSTITVDLYVTDNDIAVRYPDFDQYTEYYVVSMSLYDDRDTVGVSCELNTLQAVTNNIPMYKTVSDVFMIPRPETVSPDLFKTIAKALSMNDGKLNEFVDND